MRLTPRPGVTTPGSARCDCHCHRSRPWPAHATRRDRRCPRSRPLLARPKWWNEHPRLASPPSFHSVAWASQADSPGSASSSASHSGVPRPSPVLTPAPAASPSRGSFGGGAAAPWLLPSGVSGTGPRGCHALAGRRAMRWFGTGAPLPISRQRGCVHVGAHSEPRLFHHKLVTPCA